MMFLSPGTSVARRGVPAIARTRREAGAAKRVGSGCTQVEMPRDGPGRGAGSRMTRKRIRDRAAAQEDAGGDTGQAAIIDRGNRTSRACAHESAYILALLTGLTRVVLFSSCERLGPHTTRSFALHARQCALLSRSSQRGPVSGCRNPPTTPHSSCEGSGRLSGRRSL